MILSSCPRCHESYLIPAGKLPEDAYAQCPWCQETFPLSEAMGRLPPMLKVIRADGEIITPQIAAVGTMGGAATRYGHADSSQDNYANADTEIADDFGGETTFEADVDMELEEVPLRYEARADVDIEPEFMLRDREATPAIAPMRVQPSTAVKGSPKRKQKGSSIMSMIGVALGGVASLPIAAGLLVGIDKMGWKQAPNIGVWPLDGSMSSFQSPAPKASTAMPTSEPSMRRSATSGSPENSLAKDLGISSAPEPDPAADALAEIQSGGDSLATIQPPSEELEVAMPEISLPEMIAPEISPPATAESASAEPTSSEIVTNAKPEISKIDTPETITEPSTAPATPSAVLDKVVSPELIQARDAAIAAIDDLAKLSGDSARKPLVAKTFIAIAMMGSLAQPEDAGAIEEALAKVTRDQALLADIARAVPLWLDIPNPPNDGVVLVLDSASTTGARSLTTGSGAVVPVVAGNDITLPDGKLLGLGKVVAGPNGKQVELSVAQAL